jgi:ABC-type transporter Mla subunit MlaD
MPDPLDSLRGAIRSAIGAAEHVETDVEHHTPAGIERGLDAKLDETIAALHRAAAAGERHVEVLEGVADSLAPLTESVTRLSDQLGVLLDAMAPLEAAERDVSRVEGLFRRRRHEVPGGTPAGGSGEVPPTTTGLHPEVPS